MSHRKWWLVVPVGALLMFSLAQAQDAGGQPGQDSGQRGQRGQRGGRGGFDPARMQQFQQERMNRLKEELSATDDEWKVMQPKIEKVSTARRELDMDRMRMFGGFGRSRGGDRGGDTARPEQPQSKVGQARSELSKTLENKSASSEEINKKLIAYREARDKARADLAAAQKDLKEVATPRQEAVLVMNGMLD